jgi:low temperature requirement protein LtrA
MHDAPTAATAGLIRPFTPRDPGEDGRTASPLELFTDLCFVAAISQVAGELHHAVAANHPAEGLLRFSMLFFAIFWAWLNFTWFASAYDNDDAIYRGLTLLQVIGVLALAAGVGRAFDGDFRLPVIGYVIMRISLVVQWIRVARTDPDRRVTALRYVIGVVAVQVLWIAWLAVPEDLAVAFFFALVAAELAVPAIAERAGPTRWHPHHIAERYGLFFIIVLGETVLSATLAIQTALVEPEPAMQLLLVVGGGVLTIFGAWWLYFAKDASRFLTSSNLTAFVWGYGHLVLFAAGAALGAGLAVRVDFWTHHAEADAFVTAAAVTIPVALLLGSMWFLNVRPIDASPRVAAPFLTAVVLIIVATWLPAPELLAGLIVAGLLAWELALHELSLRPDPSTAG